MKKVVSNNKKAKFNYFLENPVEAGISLLGTEVKSVRLGKINLEEAYIKNLNGELFLCNANISKYNKASLFNHDPLRVRKLLLHRSQINKMIGKLKVSGYSMIPISAYFNAKNILKLEIALAKGKKQHDKREDIKRKEWDKTKHKILRGKK